MNYDQLIPVIRKLALDIGQTADTVVYADSSDGHRSGAPLVAGANVTILSSHYKRKGHRGAGGDYMRVQRQSLSRRDNFPVNVDRGFPVSLVVRVG